MADSPKLPSTSDSTGYAPYSFTAMLAAGLAGLFAVSLVVLGLIAFLGTQHFVQPLMLALPMVALVLSFAARRQIANSEGTRIGYSLCNFAWWVAMIGGMGYAAYLIGIGFAVRTDAAAALKIWSDHVVKADVTDPTNTEFYEAFRGVVPPGRQASISVKTPAAIAETLKEWKDDIVIFRQIDVMRIALRNKGNVEFVAGGLSQWERDVQGQGLTCTMNALMKCPEGRFELTIQMQHALNTQQELTWQIRLPAQGFVHSAKLTNYGFLIRDMETTATALVYQDMLPLFGVIGQNAVLVPAFAEPMTNAPHGLKLMQHGIGRVAAMGGPGFIYPEPKDYEEQIAMRFFTPTDRSDPSRERLQRDQFLSVWRAGRITPPGSIITENRDTGPILTIPDTLAELRMPIELQLPNGATAQTGARGAVVLICDNPTFLLKLKEARVAAASESPMEMQDRTLKFETIPWKIVRIESDMKQVQKKQPQSAPGGGPPGM